MKGGNSVRQSNKKLWWNREFSELIVAQKKIHKKWITDKNY